LVIVRYLSSKCPEVGSENPYGGFYLRKTSSSDPILSNNKIHREVKVIKLETDEKIDNQGKLRDGRKIRGISIFGLTIELVGSIARTAISDPIAPQFGRNAES